MSRVVSSSYPSVSDFPPAQLPSSSGSSMIRGGSGPISTSQRTTPEMSRRASERSTYAAPSYAGSTAGTIRASMSERRRGRDSSGKTGVNNMEDWANVDADEIFKRLPVGEAKRVEAKMRAEALNKQSELRAMVGARYRDLLTSATQITSLRSSSLRLSQDLKDIVKLCANAANNSFATDGDNVSEKSEGEEVIHMLPAAAHMKLLLDAPEVLYSFLAHHSYLSAAYLFLIARLTKESLSSLPSHTSASYLPLVQKQWEILLPFQNQISQRATNSLRNWEGVTERGVSETLLAVILLDNLGLEDALKSFLNQREKAVRDILQHSENSQSTSIETSKAHQYSGSPLQLSQMSRSVVQPRTSVIKTLVSAVQCLLSTIQLVQAIFDSRRTIKKGEESVIEEMMRLVQKGSIVPLAQQEIKGKQTTHQRRASRLVSISLPLPNLKFSSSERLPISTPEILQQLPSSEILLRHLPPSITAFTPFISSSASPALTESVKLWQIASVALLKSALPRLLEGLKSVGDIWTVRSNLLELLGDDAFSEQIKVEIEDEWIKRIQQVWDTQLSEITSSLSQLARDGSDKAGQKEEDEKKPEECLFKDLTLPFENAGAGHSTAAFAAFISSLKKRTALRTPLLNSVLQTLETQAAHVKSDMSGLPVSLCDSYTIRVQSFLERMIALLEGILENVAVSEGRVAKELFVGRIALYLAKKSSFLDEIARRNSIDRDGIETSLIEIHSKSVIKWRESTIECGLNLLFPLLKRKPSDIRSFWQAPSTHPTFPSNEVIVSLHSLVSATKHLGIPPGVNLPVIQELVVDYVKQAKLLTGWTVLEQSEEGLAQQVVDLGFLTLLSGEKPEESLSDSLQKLPSSMDTLKTDFSNIIVQALCRTQLLLYPLTVHLLPALSAQPERGGGIHNKNHLLLRFGQPNTMNKEEFRSPVPVTKLGKNIEKKSDVT
ncbi:uncharacterized protein L203_105947 [Cryptococcus depauperatus CBS 7841]|uniref:Conserved oligomeric Golgi complex subunit 1 n=1 Tax=Cryptococcus depauperatus CBS 7841 TaxID=1295531 RepID=A0AAJ8M3N7_9TREE